MAKRHEAVAKPKRPPVQISLDAHAALARALNKPHSPSMYSALSQLILWYERQKPYVQTAVISGVDEGMEVPYAVALELLAAQLREKAKRPTDDVVTDAQVKQREAEHAARQKRLGSHAK